MRVTRFAQIEPTTRCNFSCGFCAGRSMRQGSIAWNDFETFLAQHPELEHVELQGEGEPLLHPRFFDMLAACRRRAIRVSFITNGSLLRADRVDRILSEGVDSVHISLESTDAATFKSIRGGDFAEVVAGTRRLISRRRELGHGRPTVGLSVTVLRSTIEHISGIVNLYNDLGLDGGISIQPLQDMPGYVENYDPETLAEIVPPEVWRSEAYLIGAALARVQTEPDASSYYGALFADFDASQGRCPWLDQGAYLAIDGSVQPCCFVKNPEHSLGNIRHDAPEEIEERRSLLRRDLQLGTIPDSCEGCGVAAAISPPLQSLPIRR